MSRKQIKIHMLMKVNEINDYYFVLINLIYLLLIILILFMK